MSEDKLKFGFLMTQFKDTSFQWHNTSLHNTTVPLFEKKSKRAISIVASRRLIIQQSDSCICNIR